MWKNLPFSHIKIHPHICLELFCTVFASKLCLICADFSLYSDETTFSLEKAILWIEDSYFSQKQRFEVKWVLMMDLYLTNMQIFTSHDVNWWTGVVWCGLLWCFYQLFGLSFWRHPFTAEDPLVSKWCNATFLQIWWRNKFLYISDDSKSSANLHFWVNYSFKK